MVDQPREGSVLSIQHLGWILTSVPGPVSPDLCARSEKPHRGVWHIAWIKVAKSPYSKLCHNHLLTAAECGTGQLAWLFHPGED